MFKQIIRWYRDWRDSRELKKWLDASPGPEGNIVRTRIFRSMDEDRENPPILVTFKDELPHPDLGGNVYPRPVIEAALRKAPRPLPVRASVSGCDTRVGMGLVYPSEPCVLVRLNMSADADHVRALLKSGVRPDIGTVGYGSVKGGVVQPGYKLMALSLDFPLDK